MRRHTVRTKHPRYTVPVYERGGIDFLPFTKDRVEFPLDDPEAAEESISRLEEMWEEAAPYEKKVMLDTLRSGAIESGRLLEGKTIQEPEVQSQVYKTQLIYTSAYQAFLARSSEYAVD